MKNKFYRIINRIVNFFNRKDLALPNRWNNKRCYDCEIILTKDNVSEWEVFRPINGTLWAVKICKQCMQKQDGTGDKCEY
jgi:hypothetical protein